MKVEYKSVKEPYVLFTQVYITTLSDLLGWRFILKGEII